MSHNQNSQRNADAVITWPSSTGLYPRSSGVYPDEAATEVLTPPFADGERAGCNALVRLWPLADGSWMFGFKFEVGPSMLVGQGSVFHEKEVLKTRENAIAAARREWDHFARTHVHGTAEMEAARRISAWLLREGTK